MAENQAVRNSEKNLSVLITGGSGLIGRHLTSLLVSRGYNVSILTHHGHTMQNTRAFAWNPGKNTIDHEALEGVDYIIHLAGANIGSKRWTPGRKAEIVRSRVASARFLHRMAEERHIMIKAFISASATGIYGWAPGEAIFNENDPSADDFLGSVCREWEEAADLFDKTGSRTVKIRSAIVLEKNDSALSRLIMTSRFGFLIKAGTGRQYMPWIHISDLCNIYLKAVEDQEMKGVYNAVAPQHITHNEFIATLSGIMRLPVLPVPVPEFLMRSVFGEMSELILRGCRVSSEKIINSGYDFQFAMLEDALKNIMANRKSD